MSILSLRDVVKQYHNHTAVDHISFDVPKGKIFGLLGPNGAGKTSLIRIITTITMADSGDVILDGEPINFDHPSQIGYMPEERGLYKKMKVGEQLIYLAQLKGMPRKEANRKLKQWLTKFDILDWWDKKVEELSKGMQQKIQFIATVVHDPKLLILDEPFSGLDPINTNLIKDEIDQLNKNGTSIIFSTHRMEQVEEICENIVLINQGKKVLEGNVSEIKEEYKDNLYRIEFKGKLNADLKQDNFNIISDTDDELIIKILNDENPNLLLKQLLDSGIEIRSYSEVLPSLNEIFIKIVGDADSSNAQSNL
ncbi:MAG: ABC transporter ATP-binding protein [Saprospiraceae bacterium]|nr:ABC transporter ATP-binding protein [Saprospiraceae bacterium]